MKNLVYLSAAVLALAASAVGGPLRKAEISAHANGMASDADQLRSTSAGKFVTTEIADKLLAEPKARMKQDIGYDLDLSKVKSVTAYGTYSERVLLLKADFTRNGCWTAPWPESKRKGSSTRRPVGRPSRMG